MLGLAVRGEARRVAGEKSEGRRLVAPVLGQVEVDAPDGAPGRVERAQNIGEGAAGGRELLVARPMSAQSERRISASRYSAPGMGGSSAASASRTSASGGAT
jgi:hypothetical protein